MHKPTMLLLTALLLVWGCRKEPAPVADPPPVPPVVQAETCPELPPTPVPYGWTDSTTDENRNVNAFMVNPVRPEELVLIVNGDIQGYNKMFAYNVPSKQSVLLGSIGDYLPSMNAAGWLVYSTADNNVFKIKANGDSLKQITSGNITEDPRWDHTGKYIYYFQKASQSLISLLVKCTADGLVVSSIPMSLPNNVPFKKSDKVIFLKTENTIVTLNQRDMVTQEEKVLISGPYDPAGKYVHFNNLTIDKNDEFLYWSNLKGIFKCNLKSLVTDTVLKNCPRLTYLNPIISQNDNELTMSSHTITLLNSFTLYHQYKPLEMDLLTGRLTEIRVFN